MKDGKLIGLTVCYSTPDPGSTGDYAASYWVHWLGASPSWGKWATDEDNGGAGSDCDPIDMVELTTCRLQIIERSLCRPLDFF